MDARLDGLDACELGDFGRALLAEAQYLPKRDRTRAAILNAGCKLLDRAALPLLTVSDICRVAGVAHGTFYIYFADRQAFVTDLLDRFVAYLQVAMREASRSQRRDSVRATTATYYRLFEQNPGIMKCLVSHLEEFPTTRTAFQKLNREWATTVVRATQRKLAAAGRGDEVARDELYRRAYALGGMIDQYLTALFVTRDKTLASVSQDHEAVIDTLTFIWKRGMTE